MKGKNAVKQTLKILTVVTIVAGTMLSACSNQYRSADAGFTDQEVLQLIEEFQPMLATQDAASGGVVAGMLQNIRGYVVNFYAGQTGPMGSNGSFFSFSDMSLVGHPGKSIFAVEFEDGLQAVQVVFLDVTSRETLERKFMLLVKLIYNGDQSQHVTFTSQRNAYNFTEDEFEITLQSSEFNQPIVMRSYDVNSEYSDDLANAVKFRVWVSENGQEYDIGQISTLAGYGEE